MSGFLICIVRASGSELGAWRPLAKGASSRNRTSPVASPGPSHCPSVAQCTRSWQSPRPKASTLHQTATSIPPRVSRRFSYDPASWDPPGVLSASARRTRSYCRIPAPGRALSLGRYAGTLDAKEASRSGTPERLLHMAAPSRERIIRRYQRAVPAPFVQLYHAPGVLSSLPS